MTTYVVKDTPGPRLWGIVGQKVKVRAWIPPLEENWPSEAQSAEIEFLDGQRKGETEEIWASDLEEVEQ